MKIYKSAARGRPVLARSGLGLLPLLLPIALSPAVVLAQNEVPVVDLSGAQPVELATIVITASGFEQTVEDAPASISVVPGEQLRGERFTDLADALSGVQGVVTTGVANEDDIYIRGLPGEYTLILVDGRRQGTRESRANGSSGYEQSFIPPAAAIERIEVVRGPMSSLYGSDAIGGVINIITRPVPDVWTGEVTLGSDSPQDGDFGSEQTLSFHAAGPLAGDRLGLQIWGRGLDRSGSSVPGAEYAGEEYDLTGRLSFALAPDQTIHVEAGTTQVDNEEPERLDRSENARDHYAVGYDGTLHGWNVGADLQREIGERTRFSREETGLSFVEDSRSPEIENTVFDISGTRQLSFAGAHTLTLGYQRIEAVLTDQNPGTGLEEDQEFSVHQQSFFAEDEWRIVPGFALTAGVRLNQHEEYDDNLTPRLYAVWNATPALTVKGGISTGFKAPGIRQIAPGYLYTTGGGGCELDPTSDQPCGVILGDPDLEAETSTNYELGVLWSAPGLTLGATYFHNEIRDKIANARVYEPDGSYAVYPDDPRYTLFYHYNVGEAQIRGAELTADWRPTDRLGLRATYTLTDSEQRNGDYAGFPLARTPEHLANLRLDYDTTFDAFDLWGEVTYHGTEINAGLRIGGDGNAVTDGDGDVVARKYDAYTLMNIGASYDVTERVTLNGAIYNLLDEEIEPSDFGTTQPGRSFWIGATARF